MVYFYTVKSMEALTGHQGLYTLNTVLLLEGNKLSLKVNQQSDVVVRLPSKVLLSHLEAQSIATLVVETYKDIL